MKGKIVVTIPEPAPSEWDVLRLDIIVDARIVRCVLRSDVGSERTYEFNDNTDPTGLQAMTAINNHNGSAKLLNVWILEQLQALDPALDGEVTE